MKDGSYGKRHLVISLLQNPKSPFDQSLLYGLSAAINAVETLTLRGSLLGFWHTPCPGSPSAPFIVFLSTYFTCLSSFSWIGDPPGSVSGFLFLSLFTHSPFSHLSLIWWLQLSLHVESHSENCQLPSTSAVLATFNVSSHLTPIFFLLDEEAEALVSSKIYPRYPRPHSK